MIEWINKSYEDFPKQENESERTLSVTNHDDEIRLRMIIYINDIRNVAEYRITRFEYENLKTTDIDDVLLKRVCRKFRDEFIV